MKKFIIALCFAFMVFYAAGINGEAATSIETTLYVNGKYVDCEVAPYTKSGVSFVPLRAISNSLGIDNIHYNASDKSISVNDGYKIITLFINQKKVLVNGYEYYIPQEPHLTNNTTMVPMEFIADNYNLNSSWDNLTKSLIVVKNGSSPNIFTRTKEGYIPEDVLWLSRIIQVEAGYASYECKLGVANVVINRKNSSKFPNTIKEVIFAQGQFPPAHKSGFSTMIPSTECIAVAKKALNGHNNVSNSLYFNNRPFTSKSGDLYKVINGEYFYY